MSSNPSLQGYCRAIANERRRERACAHCGADPSQTSMITVHHRNGVTTHWACPICALNTLIGANYSLYEQVQRLEAASLKEVI